MEFKHSKIANDFDSVFISKRTKRTKQNLVHIGRSCNIDNLSSLQ